MGARDSAEVTSGWEEGSAEDEEEGDGRDERAERREGRGDADAVQRREHGDRDLDGRRCGRHALRLDEQELLVRWNEKSREKERTESRSLEKKKEPHKRNQENTEEKDDCGLFSFSCAAR